MGTTSAVPDALLRHAARTRQAAELLAENRSRLDAAVAALAASRPDPALLGPLPDVAGHMSVLAALTFELADHTGRIGAAFLRADAGFLHGPVTVSDQALSAALPSAAEGVEPLLADLQNAGPDERRAIVQCLPDEVIGDLIARDGSFVGNTPGIPEPVRYRANLDRVSADLRQALAHLSFHTVARLMALLAGRHGEPPQILLYDPEAHHVAVVFGDLSAAANVAVLVPGCGSTVDNFAGDTAARAYNLFEAASAVGRGGVAVIAWLGYDAPPFVAGGFPGAAEAGGRSLARLLAGLGRRPGSRLVLVGHSYGSLVVGNTMQHTRAVDDIVVLGSPGLGVDEAEDLHLPDGGHVYAEDIRGDPVGHLEAFGTAPTSRRFGGVRLTTNAPGHTPVGGGIDAHAHSQYFVPGSEALANIALVVAGRGGDAHRQTATAGEETADLDRTAEPYLHPDAGPLDELAEHYDGPGHEVVDGADRVSRVERAAEHTAVRYAVDGGLTVAKKIAGLLP